MSAAAGRGGHRERLRRSDGPAKVTGAFTYSSDLRVDGMLEGATLRSPHAAARILSIDTAVAVAVPGVHAVLTAADVPGGTLIGVVFPDQPVLASDRVRHHGEPVAIVAADDAATARRATALIDVRYELEDPLTTVAAALAPGAPQLHPGGNDLRTVRIVRGEVDEAFAQAAHVVTGTYDVGTQDQAFLGPESGVAVPDGAGGVVVHTATQWLHVDRDQVAAGLGLPPERVQLVLGGVGGAFGAREDLSMQLHAAMLALRTGRPVRMAYPRAESFLGHVHRHPAQLEYEHAADADGRLLGVRARVLLDGGAYASSSTAVVVNAATVACGPYAVPNALIEATVAYTNNPPNGAMRGFGAVQVAIAYEAQMDRLAAVTGLDPLVVRARNALAEGGTLPTLQAIDGPVPVARLCEELAALPPAPPPREDPRARPGGAFASTRGEGVRRGVGYALGFKNIAFSEGFDDPATARVRLLVRDGHAAAEVHTAASEVGQGVVGIQEQVARTELGVDDVRVLTADTTIASAGSASASRLTWMISGAVQGACADIRAQLLAAAAARTGVDAATLTLAGGHVHHAGTPLLSVVDVLEHGGPLTADHTYRHRPTHPMDPATGHGDVHAGFAFCGHRATVDVDVELGLARVVELACVQDVGRAMNPLALEGQLEGASIQGLGLAVMEDLVLDRGLVQTRSFGEYRIPTIVDAAAVPTVILELGDPETPYGLKGVGELPSISSTPAVLAALRAATGHALTRVPALPEQLVVE
jgi:xanthine dehydrogenase D subunit